MEPHPHLVHSAYNRFDYQTSNRVVRTQSDLLFQYLSQCLKFEWTKSIPEHRQVTHCQAHRLAFVHVLQTHTDGEW